MTSLLNEIEGRLKTYAHFPQQSRLDDAYSAEDLHAGRGSRWGASPSLESGATLATAAADAAAAAATTATAAAGDDDYYDDALNSQGSNLDEEFVDDFYANQLNMRSLAGGSSALIGVAVLRRLLHRFRLAPPPLTPDMDPEILPLRGNLSMDGVARAIVDGQCTRVLAFVGAGAAAAAQIPTVAQLADSFDISLKEAYDIFDAEVFARDATRFYRFAQQLAVAATAAHRRPPLASYAFLHHLQRRNALLRVYTQNMDDLERAAGIEEDRLVRVHGTLMAPDETADAATCLGCGRRFPLSFVRQKALAHQIPRCDTCGSVIKPPVTLFGDALPNQRLASLAHDLLHADLVLLIGTSLTALPIGNAYRRVRPHVPRIVFNTRLPSLPPSPDPFPLDGGLRLGAPNNIRDVFIAGDCHHRLEKLLKKLKE